MVFPVIQFLFPFEEDDFDLTKYILQAEFDGRLKHNEGGVTAAGDLCTLTAAASKDLYLTAAKCTFVVDTLASSTSLENEVVLKVNGTIVETTKHSHTAASGGTGFVYEYEFKNIGLKVDATQILKLEVITLDADVSVEGFIQAIEVPDGENPVNYTGA